MMVILDSAHELALYARDASVRPGERLGHEVDQVSLSGGDLLLICGPSRPWVAQDSQKKVERPTQHMSNIALQAMILLELTTIVDIMLAMGGAHATERTMA